MQGNAKATRPEIALRSALHRQGLRFLKDRRPVPSIRCRADIVFPAARVAVFVDGCFWHCCPLHGSIPTANRGYWAAKLQGNAARDRRNDEALTAVGWRVIRVWEHESLEVAVDRIGSALCC